MGVGMNVTSEMDSGSAGALAPTPWPLSPGAAAEDISSIPVLFVPVLESGKPRTVPELEVSLPFISETWFSYSYSYSYSLEQEQYYNHLFSLYLPFPSSLPILSPALFSPPLRFPFFSFSSHSLLALISLGHFFLPSFLSFCCCYYWAIQHVESWFPDQELNHAPLHWEHQGSPYSFLSWFSFQSHLF